MAQNKLKTLYFCTQCGNESAKWYGKCPACGAWDSLREAELAEEIAPAKKGGWSTGRMVPDNPPESLESIDITEEIRFKTGFGELDRVLGGGAVKGSLVLFGGEPGIGKSTLLLQICQRLGSEGRVLYASGEESKRQLKLRAERLGVSGKNVMIMSETKLEAVLSAVEKELPDILMIDSIQTIYKAGLAAAPGNAAQIRDCTMTLLQLAKTTGIVVFIVGHVNKEGEIAGPKIMEHMVDCVLYFEGERQNSYRVLRGAKNRFGSTNEVGIFEMGSHGLVEVPNPSAALLSGRPENVPGTCITCTIEGSRPILAEIQALVSPTVFGNPRRMSSGIDYNRAVLLLAVLEKRAGLYVNNADTYINVVGGLRIDEPAADLATVIAVASSFRDLPVKSGTVVFGEVGLTGELRRVSALEQRLSEAARLSIRRCVCPGPVPANAPNNMEVISVSNVREAIEACLQPAEK